MEIKWGEWAPGILGLRYAGMCHSPLRSDPGYQCLAPLGLQKHK